MEVVFKETVNIPQDPIFIIGYPRSGTTLLQALIATQPGIYSFPETHFFPTIAQVGEVDELGFIQSACVDKLLAKIREKTGLQFSSNTASQLSALAEKNILHIKWFFELIVYQYLHKETNHKNVGKYRWVEKTPYHIHYLDRIHDLYPDAQFVAIVRHPIPAVISRKKKLPMDGHLPVSTLAGYWAEMIHIMEEFRNKHPETIYIMRYENLVEQRNEIMDQLCNFLNFKLKPELLDRFSIVGTGLIHQWEAWKIGVISQEIVNTNNTYNGQINLMDTFRIQHVVQNKMNKYSYKISHPMLQKAFDLLKFLKP